MRRAPVTLRVHVLEQVRPADISALLHQSRQPPVLEVDQAILPALATEREPDVRPADRHMTVLERGKTIRTVRSLVFLVPHPDERRLEQRHQQRQHLLPRRISALEVAPDAAHASPGSSRANSARRPYFGLPALGAPGVVIAVLLSPPRIPPRRLDVRSRVGRDPHLAPRRRNRELADARERAGVPYRRTRGPLVSEGTSAALPRNARYAIGDDLQGSTLWCQCVILQITNTRYRLR